MAPGSGKRKRPERQTSDDDDASSRASPYRPEKSRMASRPTSSGTTLAADADGERQEQDAGIRMSASGRLSTANGGLQEPPATSTETSTPVPDGIPHANGTGRPSAEPTPQDERPPYRYTYVTDEFLESWDDTGSQATLDTGKTLDELQTSNLLQELVRSALDGRLSGPQAGHAIRKLIAARREDDGPDVEFLFLNILPFLYDANYRGDAIKSLVGCTGIDQQTMRQELDIPLLQDLGLVRSTFDKMRTRKTTNMLYRQANYNLLREESEGYAKLVTDYFNTAQEASMRQVVDPYMAEDAFQRVTALVGAFDLDVGRVLDITLDVSANLLVRAYPFFMKFYRASSWWPKNDMIDNIKWEDQGFGSLPAWALPGSGRSFATEEEKHHLAILRQRRDFQFWNKVRENGTKAFFELDAKRIANFDAVLPLLETEMAPELDSRGKEADPYKRERANEDRKYMRETRCMPPCGNYDAAQLLGFKLRFYASDARDANDVLPDNLIYLVALLIKMGFVSLRDLYPHLYPLDEKMADEKTRLEKEKAEREAKDRPGGGSNALSMAGALPDDTPAPRITRVEKEKSGAATPSQDKEEDAEEALPPPANQKLILLKALLLIGAIPEALYVLGRFPWLVDVDLDLPLFLHRIARHMLSKVGEELTPLSDQGGLQDSREQLADTTLGPDGTLQYASRPPKKVLRWLHNDSFDKDGVEYQHYYGDWSDNVPVCQTFDNVYLLCDTFLGFLGPKIGQDVELYSTLLRLAHRSLTDDSSDGNRSRWLVLLRRLLVPALSCTKHNPQLTHQVFELLKVYNLTTRFDVYSEWFLGSTSRQPDVRAAFARNAAEVNIILRRVSNETIKQQGRALGKISLASPGIVLLEMINQLKTYSNFIPSFVECTRYFSSMTYEVLIWALIKSLGSKEDDRMQKDGMLTSPWLQAIAQFVATLFTRYSYINPVPILQYLASELRTGNTTNLAMLEHMLVEMAGIRSDVEFNDVQVIAMAGGEALQSYIMQQLSDTRHNDEKKKPAKRLMQALSESKLTGQFLIAIAQEQQIYANQASLRFAPLKVIGNNLDRISAVFAQYLEVLKTHLKAEDLESALPNVGDLVQHFGLGPGVALTVHRIAIRSRVNEYDSAKKQEEQSEKKDKTDSEGQAKDGDIAMKDVVATESSADPGDQEDDAIVLDSKTPNGPASGSSEALDLSPVPWHPILEPIIQQLHDASPELAARVSIPFFVTFWTLAHQDILVPTDSYQRETNRIEQQIKEINADRSDMTATAAKGREKKKRDLQQWFDRLKSEPMQHMSAYMAVRNRINGSKSGGRIVPGENQAWFPATGTKDIGAFKAENDAKHLALLQECFLPRAIQSAVDAHYSFEMLKLMHANATPGFSLMHLLVQLFKKQKLTALIFQCTANEAQHLARLLWEILKLLHRWHGDKTTYEKEALGSKKKLRGFVKVFEDNGEPKTVMDFEDFRRMLFNFHAYLNSSLQACFESTEYMHIRNGIIVLKGIHQVFPALKFMGKNMLDHVKKVAEKDARSDLKLAAMSLRGPLLNREKHWVMPQAFRLGEAAKEGTRSASRGASAPPESPETPKLNATAAEFKPTTSSGNGRKESTIGGPEDGEIEDEKAAAAKAGDSAAKDVSKPIEKPSAKPANQEPLPVKPLPTPESKPSTPAPLQSRPAPRQQTPQRTESRLTSTRPAQSFPNRADSSLKPHPSLPEPRTGNRYSAGGDVRDERLSRLDRPDARPVPREHSAGHRTGRGRTPPPIAGRGSLRDDQPYNRPSTDSRYSRDEPHHSRRDGPSRESQQHSTPPIESRDRPPIASRQSDGPVHPERMGQMSSVAVAPEAQRSTATSQPQQDSQQHYVNPARLAMMADDESKARGSRERPHAEQERGQPPFQSRPDSRLNGRALPDTSREASIQSRQESQSDLAPTGPSRGRARDVAPSPVESNYGRLNAPPEPPSGPKNAPNGRNGRNFTAPQPLNARGNESAGPPSTSRHPESPATLRGPPRQPSGPASQMNRQLGPSSAPSTPASDNGPPVHPSRAAQLGQQPAPIHTNAPPPNGPRHAESPTIGLPCGPRSSGRTGGPPSGTPTGPSPANNVTPTGPATPVERQRRQDRQRANINATLQGAVGAQPTGPQGMQFKGASSRQASMPQPPQPARGGPQAGTSSMEPPQGRSHYDDNQSGPRPDLFQTKPDRDGRGGRHREEPRSHHGSRHPSRERHGSHELPIQPPSGPDDGRNHRGGPGDERAGREERLREPPLDGPRGSDTRRASHRPPRFDDSLPRRPLADSPAPYNGPPMGDWQRGQQPPEDNRRGGRGAHPPSGPGGRQDEFARNQQRREEDRRESRGPSRDEGPPLGPDGRKRRHEEPSGPFDGAAKRRRSGR